MIEHVNNLQQHIIIDNVLRGSPEHLERHGSGTRRLKKKFKKICVSFWILSILLIRPVICVSKYGPRPYIRHSFTKNLDLLSERNNWIKPLVLTEI